MRRALFVLSLIAMPAFGESIYPDVGPCKEQAPETKYALPLCADYELHSALIASAEAGDTSAIALLRQRYALADTYSERHRIAEVLLRLADDDDHIYRDVIANAELAVQFAKVDGDMPDEFFEWCAEDIEPYDHFHVLQEAFSVVKADPRARPLLLKALKTSDDDLISAAVWGLAEQKAFDALPEIESALGRMREPMWAALSLSDFHDQRTDAIARKYLTEYDLELYYNVR